MWYCGYGEVTLRVERRRQQPPFKALGAVETRMRISRMHPAPVVGGKSLDDMAHAGDANFVLPYVNGWSVIGLLEVLQARLRCRRSQFLVGCRGNSSRRRDSATVVRPGTLGSDSQRGMAQ
jgi:hypothetical protein